MDYMSLESRISLLMTNVKLAKREDCQRVLVKNNLNLVAAQKELLVNQLITMQLGDEQRCTDALRATNWQFEQALTKLLRSSK